MLRYTNKYFKQIAGQKNEQYRKSWLYMLIILSMTINKHCNQCKIYNNYFYTTYSCNQVILARPYNQILQPKLLPLLKVYCNHFFRILHLAYEGEIFTVKI